MSLCIIAKAIMYIAFAELILITDLPWPSYLKSGFSVFFVCSWSSQKS